MMSSLLSIFNSETWLQIRDYFFSVYENSLLDLAIFTLCLLFLFMVRGIYLKRAVRKSRQEIALVIGGWGTRGKSSVERLKGALFNSLGYGVLSKTTGCEAMFLHGHAYDRMREMFIFRPYDKATIWEQHSLTRLAARLETEVFLWECMGLTPAYVHILQREWMHDDMSTITNTYPDHEDIQGPAGINIPEVMTNFIPKGSFLVTSEEQMLPILETASGKLRTGLKPVSWLEAGLVTDDILKRFPYEEHPYNIALVLAMAEELGIEKDFVLKEMADNVIPDIGMLKVYPPAPLRSRQLEFVSGNSANERFGALSNWKRTGFDRHGLDRDPNIWVCTVVNNRADRIPRSKVFARILVEDIRADLHFLIGSNLSGLSGYIKEALEESVDRMTLFPESGEKSGGPEKIFMERAKWLRVPIFPNQIQGRLGHMIQGVCSGKKIDRDILKSWNDPDRLKKRLEEAGMSEMAHAIVSFVKKDLALLEEVEKFRMELKSESKKDREKLDEKFRELARRWFLRKIVVIWDFHATGNQIIHQICENSPPGLYCRIMGLQNIKGTGLDFVYSWQRWERCFLACNALKSQIPAEINQGLRDLGGFQEYNILCEQYTRETIEEVKKLPIAQNEKFQAELTMILSNLENNLEKISLESSGGEQNSWFMNILGFIEALQDASDAVKRRKIATRIYEDLATERISHETAALELQALNKRQKGGWLTRRFQKTHKKKKDKI